MIPKAAGFPEGIMQDNRKILKNLATPPDRTKPPPRFVTASLLLSGQELPGHPSRRVVDGQGLRHGPRRAVALAGHPLARGLYKVGDAIEPDPTGHERRYGDLVGGVEDGR